MKTDFTNIEYLKEGNSKQQKVFEVLTQSGILNTLKAFDPILVGTIPINIDVENSDLDIVCYDTNLKAFGEMLVAEFGDKPDFTIWERGEGELKAVVASFYQEEFNVEVFGQAIPSQEQNAYRHMIIEHEILLEKGEEFRQKVIALKQMGYKTEPAFAKLLELDGDPFVELLKFDVEK